MRSDANDLSSVHALSKIEPKANKLNPGGSSHISPPRLTVSCRSFQGLSEEIQANAEPQLKQTN
jgi:hypothetical protein